MAVTTTPDTSKTVLYTFEDSERFQKYGAPRLLTKVPAGVDVTGDFPWTTLPKDTRWKVPSIQLREFRVTSSTLIQSFIQQARSAVDAVGGSGENVVKNVKNGLQIMGFSVSDETIDKWLNRSINVTDHSFLDPYKHLYPVTPTGWQYTFPFLTGQNQRTASEWSEKNRSDIGEAITQLKVKGVGGSVPGIALNALEVGGMMSKIGNVLEPGSYTETIKHYTPPEGESYKVQFTLSNTGKFSDVQRNWELCFVLTYQNRSNRRSVSLLDPPVIYHTTIPGVNQMLYSYISNLQIDNLGTSRYIDFPIGQKLIPEAYQVSFDIKSLLTPTQNLLLYAHTGSKVEVSVQ
jgi:hypothetical protein